MQPIDFRDIAHLINFSRTTNIEPLPFKSKDGRWSFYQGTHKIHTSKLSFKVLYLNSAATQEDIRSAAREFSNEDNVHVVYAPSLERSFRGKTEIGSILNRAAGVWTTREYLVSFIKEEVQTYIKKLEEQSPTDYINPRVETPSGFNIKLPNPLLSFLRDPEYDKANGRLGILLAEPGQGKTYMSRYLVSRISAQDKIPLMVDSSQWHTMPLEDQKSLPKTIAHSFRHFGATIGWLEGHEDDFLKATLKADVFRIVFDGFDEYILRNQGAVQPMDVLETLADLASSTGTRIIITSRTSFWNTNLPEAEVESFLAKTKSSIFKILPFDLENAKNYFVQRFNDHARQTSAIKIYTELLRRNDAFVGRGFVLSLVADLADKGGLESNRENDPSKAMLWLIEALCEREVLRQQLPLSAKEQMDLMSLFAIEVAEGGVPNTELLELSMSDVHETLDSESVKMTIEKLKSHPLLTKTPSGDRWAFKQEQLRILLMAEKIVEWNNKKIQQFIAKAKLDPGSWQDLGVTIVDILRFDLTEDLALEQLEQIILAMSSVRETNPELLLPAEDGCRLAGVIALTTVERFLPRGSSHSERAELLLRLCGKTAINNLSLSGTIARFDFAGVLFEKCRFERVAWANCKFDEGTHFRNCQLIGGVPPAHCVGFGSVKLSDCRLDPEAEAIFNSVRVKEHKRKYSGDDLRTDIHSIVSKFIIKGGIGLKTVESDHLLRGTITASQYRDEIVDVLLATVLEEHRLPSSAHGFNVRKDAVEAVKFYAANNVLTGQLREAFEKLQRKLSL